MKELQRRIQGNHDEHDDYLAGQQLQWALFCEASGRAGRSRRAPARGVRVHVVVDGEPSVHLVQDDPQRRTFLVERPDGPVLVCPEHRSVRIHGSWYTCPAQDRPARQDRELLACA
jgi:hypothetical protein